MVSPIPPTTRLLKSSRRFAASAQQPTEATTVSLQERIKKDNRHFMRIKFSDPNNPASSCFDTVMVDTGAEATYLSIAAHQKVPTLVSGTVNARTLNGPLPTIVREMDVKLPEQTFPKHRVGVREGLYGLLGRDLLWYYRVTLFPKDMNKAPEVVRVRKANVPLPTQDTGYITKVKLNEDETPYRFYVETGMQRSIISINLAQRLNLTPLPEDAVTITRPGEIVHRRQALLATLKVQGQVVRDLKVMVGDEALSYGCDGFLGMDVLGQFITTLDPEQMTISLRPPSKKTNRR